MATDANEAEISPRFDRALALVLGGLVMCGSLVWSVPGLGPLDAGDLVAAVVAVGVPHPTGFPAWLLTTSPFVALPIGTLATRVAWASALAAGVTAWAFVRVLQTAATGLSLVERRVAGVFVALPIMAAFVVLEPVALQARMPEVYLLQTALVAGTVWALHRLAVTRDLRWVGWVGLLLGIGVANHALFRLLAPLFVVAALRFARPAVGRALGLGALGALLGSLAWLRLPASALADPRHNWGDPSSLGRMYDVVQATAIREAFADEMLAGHAWTLWHAGELLAPLRDAWGALLWLAPVGAWMLWRTRVPSLRLLLLAALVDGVYSVWINPMGLRDHQNAQIVGIVSAICIGLPLAGLVILVRRRAGTAWWGVAAAAVVVACLPFVPTEDAPRGHHLAHDHHVDDLVAALAGYTPPGAVLAPVSDTPSAALLYGDVVLDARPDAVWIGRWVLSDPLALRHWCRHHAPCPFDDEALHALDRSTTLGWAVPRLLEWARAEDRAVYFEVSPGVRDLPRGVHLFDQWPWGRVAPVAGELLCGTSPVAWCDDAPDVAFGASARAHALTSLWYRRFLATRHAQRASQRLAAGDLAGAEGSFRMAAEWTDRAGPWEAGVALALARQCRLAEALEWTDRAVDAQPGLRNALRNGVLYAAAAEDVARHWRYAALAARYGTPIDVQDAEVTEVRRVCGLGSDAR